MKTATLAYLLSLSFATAIPADTIGGDDGKRDDPKIAEALRTTPWAIGPGADAFQEALHVEEVARDLDTAAAQYGVIVKKHRARDDDWLEGIAAVSLFRIAEIRRKQGREEEARKLYGEVAEEFQDWEPMVSLSRQQLGLDPSDFQPVVTQVEDDRPLTDDVERTLWHLRTRVCDDNFVLVTFEVEPDEENAYEGMPASQQVQTLHYLPNGPLSGTISSSRVLGEAVKIGKVFGDPVRGTLGTRIDGFGHSFEVPSGLRRTMALSIVDSSWIGLRDSSFDTRVVLEFRDEIDEESKVLKVRFTLATIAEAKARELTESSAAAFPSLEDQGWSFTLPPAPGSLEKAYRGKGGDNGSAIPTPTRVDDAPAEDRSDR